LKTFGEESAMEEEKNKIYTVVALLAVATLLLSCIVGALAGGVAGFVVGRRQARVAAEQVFEEGIMTLPEFDEGMPWHRQEEHPMFPPDLDEEFPPFDTGGALIVEVIPGTPADEADLEEGDIITAVDRTPIDVDRLLPDVLGQYEPGDLVTIRFWREGREESARIKLAAHPDNPRRAYLGVYYEMLEWPHFDTP
jgi:hypothetical protein